MKQIYFKSILQNTQTTLLKRRMIPYKNLTMKSFTTVYSWVFFILTLFFLFWGEPFLSKMYGVLSTNKLYQDYQQHVKKPTKHKTKN